MEKNIEKMNKTLKGLYQEKKITLSEWERTLKWYQQDGNRVEFCKTCSKPKVSDGLDTCYECYNKIRDENMTEKNIKEKIKEAVDTNKNKKVKSQIANGFKIAEKWKKARKLQEVIDKALFDNEQELITKTLEQQEE